MKKKVEQTVLLEALYVKANTFDDSYTELIDVCLNLNKLDKEEEIYLKMGIPDIIENVLKSLDYDRSLLLEKKEKLEAKMNEINIDEVMELIEMYQ